MSNLEDLIKRYAEACIGATLAGIGFPFEHIDAITDDVMTFMPQLESTRLLFEALEKLE